MFALLLSAVLAAASPAPAPPNCAPASGFTGTVCAPKSPGRHPAILLLGGSEGGDSMKDLLPRFAAEGYVAVSVPYFAFPVYRKSIRIASD